MINANNNIIKSELVSEKLPIENITSGKLGITILLTVNTVIIEGSANIIAVLKSMVFSFMFRTVPTKAVLPTTKRE